MDDSPWICQPYVRPRFVENSHFLTRIKSKRNGVQRFCFWSCSPTAGNRRLENDDQVAMNKTRSSISGQKRFANSLSNNNTLSKKKLKKLMRNPKKAFSGCGKMAYELCASCRNPKVSVRNLALLSLRICSEAVCPWCAQSVVSLLLSVWLSGAFMAEGWALDTTVVRWEVKLWSWVIPRMLSVWHGARSTVKYRCSRAAVP